LRVRRIFITSPLERGASDEGGGGVCLLRVPSRLT